MYIHVKYSLSYHILVELTHYNNTKSLQYNINDTSTVDIRYNSSGETRKSLFAVDVGVDVGM